MLMNIIQATKNELKDWAKLSVMLFPHLTFEEAFNECKAWLLNKNEQGLLYQENGKIIGFMNLSIRNDYVNGTEASPVVFVEALYILPEHRKKGIGRKFIEYAENFAKQRGISQIASDCLIENASSEAFHKSCGFIEKERVICFAKDVC
jgi:aminoglycoside 6'-N-acetyltransferase I